jgi:hypothetical protein
VRGVAPYYLRIPELNSILFVTESPSGDHAVFHILNLVTKEEVDIQGRDLHFGGAIGGPVPPDKSSGDYIEHAEKGKIVLAMRRLDWKQIAVLNLDAKSIEGTETFHYDTNGNTVRHYTNGRLTQSP